MSELKRTKPVRKNPTKGKKQKVFMLSSNLVLEVYVLRLLSNHTMYGKEIADAIRDRMNETWDPSHGLIYPILRDMEDKGYLEGEWDDEEGKKRGVRYYSITDAGRKHLEEKIEEIKPFLTRSQQMIETFREDFLRGDGNGAAPQPE